MSKPKSIFTVKIYRRVSDEQNAPLNVDFGAFSTELKAVNWVKKNGKQAVKDFAKGHKRDNLFFMILEYLIDSPGNEWGFATLALDSNGNSTKMFKKP